MVYCVEVRWFSFVLVGPEGSDKKWLVRRLLRVPWTARRANQSIPKEINPEYSVEALTLKPKLQSFGQPDAKSQLTEKDPDARKDCQ